MQAQLNQFMLDVSAYPSALYAFLFLIGLSLGSFINVVIYRLPIMIENSAQTRFNLMVPRSCCPHCKTMILAKDNIPLVSFLNLQGKCRACKTPISWRYPLVELISGLLLVYLAHHFSNLSLALSIYTFVMTLIALTLIDWGTQLLPNALTFPLIGLGLFINYHGLLTDFESAWIGAITGYFILWSIYCGFKLMTGKEGMGYGDFKLLSGIGAWLGWQALLPTIIISSLLGSVIGLGLIYFKKQESDLPIPFGPFLSLAGIICLLTDNIFAKIYL